MTERSIGGMVEYWSGSNNDYNFPKSVSFESKVETDLYEFAKENIGSAFLKIILYFSTKKPIFVYFSVFTLSREREKNCIMFKKLILFHS